MTKDDFIKVINLLVDKRLEKIMKDLPNMIHVEIENYMKKGISPDPSEYESDTSKLISDPYRKNTIIKDDKSYKIKTESRHWSDNNALNNILNTMQQTYVPNKKSNDMGSYQQLLESEYNDIGNEFTFNTSNMNTLLNETAPTAPSVINTPSVAQMPSSKEALATDLAENGASTTIVNAMVKDYRSLLKKADSIAKRNRNA